jgi:hypothetical protein
VSEKIAIIILKTLKSPEEKRKTGEARGQKRQILIKGENLLPDLIILIIIIIEQKLLIETEVK